MFYQDVILRLSLRHLLPDNRQAAACRTGRWAQTQRGVLNFPLFCCLFARAHSVAIPRPGCLTLFFH